MKTYFLLKKTVTPSPVAAECVAAAAGRALGGFAVAAAAGEWAGTGRFDSPPAQTTSG